MANMDNLQEYLWDSEAGKPLIDQKEIEDLKNEMAQEYLTPEKVKAIKADGLPLWSDKQKYLAPENINHELKEFINKVKGIDATKPEQVKAIQRYCLLHCGESLTLENIKDIQAGKCDNLEVTSVIYLTPPQQDQMQEQFDKKENQEQSKSNI